MADDFETMQPGLRFRDEVVGDGPQPTPGQKVTVHYTGWLEPPERPLRFPISRYACAAGRR